MLLETEPVMMTCLRDIRRSLQNIQDTLNSSLSEDEYLSYPHYRPLYREMAGNRNFLNPWQRRRQSARYFGFMMPREEPASPTSRLSTRGRTSSREERWPTSTTPIDLNEWSFSTGRETQRTAFPTPPSSPSRTDTS